MPITVVITTWQVPFDQVVQETIVFWGDDAAKKATDHINAESLKWRVEHESDRSVLEGQTAGYGTSESWGAGYEPIDELGYNTARYELWGGESGFHAMIDQASYARLHEEHYAREYDAKGIMRPGYLINAYVAGHKPGEMTEAEAEKYAREQAAGIAEIEAAFSKPKN
jgi:hypothetical protein